MIKQLSRVALMGVLFAALTAFTVGFQTIKIQTSAVCGMCKDRIEGTLNAVDGVEEARLDLTTKKVKIKFDDSKQSEASLKAIITKIGYAADDLPANETAFNALPGCCKSVAACKASKTAGAAKAEGTAKACSGEAKTAEATKACAKGASASKACCASKAKGTAAASTEAPAKACASKGAAASGKACCASKAKGTAATETATPAKACCSGAKAKACAKDKAGE